MFDLKSVFISVMDEMFPIQGDSLNGRMRINELESKGGNPLDAAKMFVENAIGCLEMRTGQLVDNLCNLQASSFLIELGNVVKSEIDDLKWSVYQRNISAELEAINNCIESNCIEQAGLFLSAAKRHGSARIASNHPIVPLLVFKVA
jgi:hypothetical protein